MSTPRCPLCATTDPDRFPPSAHAKAAARGHVSQWCRECRKVYYDEYRATHKEQMAAQGQAYRDRPEIRERRRQEQSKRYKPKTEGRRRQFRVELAPGLPRRRSWERREREDAPKWWERGSKGAWQPQPVARKEDAA